MPQLLESTSERLVYKAYASAVIDPTTEPSPASDPATSGGQILRHVSHNLSLTKEAYAADEIRTDKQRPMEKHGTRRVPGTINGLLSAGTHQDLFEAVLGGTWSVSAITASQTDFTSVTADASTAKFTFSAGNPVTKGFRVGDIIQFADLSDADNNGVNFMIIGFGGTSNREVSVYPAPETMTADSAFTLTTIGRSLITPSSAHVARKYAVEVHNSDGDISRLFTEGLFSGFDLSLAPNQNAQINFSGMWRNRVVYSAGDAPFFASPTAETTSDIISSMDALLRINGAVVGVATGLSINYNREPSAPAQLNRDGLAAGILLANAIVTGQFTVFLTATTFLDAFNDGTEMELIAYLPASNAAAAAALTLYLPRLKINSNQEVVVDGAKALQCGFTAARYLGSGAGIESTSIRITDTSVS
ncbi:MAG: phage tail tube protein [Reyranella sp.]|uniref:phage tail tube protein n=1 Tax=Reyranella sp. TaxID=1929291 RepID=UPI003D14BCEE